MTVEDLKEKVNGTVLIQVALGASRKCRIHARSYLQLNVPVNLLPHRSCFLAGKWQIDVLDFKEWVFYYLLT